MESKKYLYPGIEQAEQQRTKTNFNNYDNVPTWKKEGYTSEDEYLDKVFKWDTDKILRWFNID